MISQDDIVLSIFNKYGLDKPSDEDVYCIGFYCGSHQMKDQSSCLIDAELKYLDMIDFFHKNNSTPLEIRNVARQRIRVQTGSTMELVDIMKNAIEKEYWIKFHSYIRGWYEYDLHCNSAQRSRVPNDFPKLPDKGRYIDGAEYIGIFEINDAFIKERMRTLKHQKRYLAKDDLTSLQHIGKVSDYLLNYFNEKGIFNKDGKSLTPTKQYAIIFDLLKAFKYDGVELDSYIDEEDGNIYSEKYRFVTDSIKGYRKTLKK